MPGSPNPYNFLTATAVSLRMPGTPPSTAFHLKSHRSSCCVCRSVVEWPAARNGSHCHHYHHPSATVVVHQIIITEVQLLLLLLLLPLFLFGGPSPDTMQLIARVRAIASPAIVLNSTSMPMSIQQTQLSNRKSKYKSIHSSSTVLFICL